MSRMLVIDDDARKRKMLHDILGAWGHDIVEADSGETGLELCQQQEFDLLFVDLVMPGMNGYRLLLKLCELPINKPQRVILNSSLFPEEELVSFGKLCGIQHILAMPTPLSLKGLKEVVQTALDAPLLPALPTTEPAMETRALIEKLEQDIDALHKLRSRYEIKTSP